MSDARLAVTMYHLLNLETVRFWTYKGLKEKRESLPCNAEAIVFDMVNSLLDWARSLFGWIIRAQRPLRLTELLVVMALPFTSEGIRDTENGDMPINATASISAVSDKPTTTPGDLIKDLFTKSYDLGVRIHTNFWATSWDDKKGQTDYETRATEIDEFVYKHQDFMILVAAGDHGEKATNHTGHIGGASAAKNCITVGATGSKRANDGNRWRQSKGDDHLGIDQTARFSSRGPTKPDATGLGSRIKPDLVAPGVAILSAASGALAVDDWTRRRYGKSHDLDWMFMSGTSMSTPLVAGCVALLREALQQHGKQHPSAAPVKTLLINGAENRSDTAHSGLGYDCEQSFGRVDIQRSISMIRELSFVDGVNVLENTTSDVPALRQSIEQERKWESDEIPVPKGRNKIAVTLAYPDRKGGLLQHDLNLIVQSAGTERHGNMGKNDGFDHTNNVEKVIWDNIPGSSFKVIVKVFNSTKPREALPFSVAWYIQPFPKL